MQSPSRSRRAEAGARERTRALIAVALVAFAQGCGGPPSPSALATYDDSGELIVVAGTFDRSCEEVTSILFECGRWELFVHLAQSAQSPGEKPIASPDIWAQSFRSDGRYDGAECSMWGNLFDQGTIDLTAEDESTVTFTIAGTKTDTFDADGSYVAQICNEK